MKGKWTKSQNRKVKCLSGKLQEFKMAKNQVSKSQIWIKSKRLVKGPKVKNRKTKLKRIKKISVKKKTKTQMQKYQRS